MRSLLRLVGGSWSLVLAAMTASLICGAANALLVVTINGALHGDRQNWTALMIFVGLALLAMLSQVASRALFAHLGQQCLAGLRRRIAATVIAAPHRALEATGQARVLALLTDDATAIANFFVGLPIMATNAVVVCACLAYLAYLSWPMFIVAFAMILASSAGYHLCHERVLRYLRLAGKKQDELFGQLESLVRGSKELKLNRVRARRFLDEVLGGAVDAVRENRTKGLWLLSLTLGWGRILFLLLIGAVLFAPLLAVDVGASAVTGYVIVFLFVMGPLEGILVHLPDLNLARVALARIDAVSEQLQPEARGREATELASAGQVTLGLQGITHSYPGDREDETFVLGPVDLTLRPGTATFVVGGNGCGKTTLAKVATGLYRPEAGQLLINGQAVAPGDEDDYRQLVSAVFSDFHLFETLLEAKDTGLDRKANGWLRKLHLDHKVAVEEGAFSTRDLSQGQRKRLALIAACLEDRPIMVLDEWAADQDPAFKEIFYREIIEELKAAGKTLLVISHDDRYFDLADQVVKLERGQVVEFGPVTGVGRQGK